MFTSPYAVELLTGRINQRCLISEYSSLKVATVIALHSYAGSCKVGRANVGSLEIEYKHLEMDSWAQHPL